jgi:lipopolysaccharide transport system ATP-binding protein
VTRSSLEMSVRLAFAVAAHLEPEILLVDEVLAVGDQRFQQRCLGKMQDVASEGRTIVFVSHNLHAIQRLCDRAYLLDGGRLVREGAPSDVIAAYIDLVEPEQAGGSALIPADDQRSKGTGEALLRRVTMMDLDGTVVNKVRFGQGFRLTLEFDVRERIETAIEVSICTVDGRPVASALSVDDDGPPIPMSPGSAAVMVEFDEVRLTPAEYVFSVRLRRASFPKIDYVERALRFTVLHFDEFGSAPYRWPVLPSIRASATWSAERVTGDQQEAASS